MAKGNQKVGVSAGPGAGAGKVARGRQRTAAGQQLAILFRVEAKPGKQQELFEFLQRDSRECLSEAGTLRFDVLQDPATDRAFYVYEVYENAVAFEAHKRGKAYKHWSSDEFQTQVLAECCGFRKLAHGCPLALMPPLSTMETVATFDGPMPIGVTVSRESRIFVNFPRWGDAVDFTVAELKDRKPVPYPDAVFNRLNKDRPAASLVSVQSVVVDPDDRLWLLDTGRTEFGRTLPGGPKLVGVDLKTNEVFKTIRFRRDVALKTTYLNDIRFDLRRGKGGVAYITDSSPEGPNGLL